MQLQPLGDRVVVTATDDAESRTPSGLVIPDTAKEKPQIGEVVAVGPGARDEDGDRIDMDVSVFPAGHRGRLEYKITDHMGQNELIDEQTHSLPRMSLPRSVHPTVSRSNGVAP